MRVVCAGQWLVCHVMGTLIPSLVSKVLAKPSSSLHEIINDASRCEGRGALITCQASREEDVSTSTQVCTTVSCRFRRSLEYRPQVCLMFQLEWDAFRGKRSSPTTQLPSIIHPSASVSLTTAELDPLTELPYAFAIIFPPVALAKPSRSAWRNSHFDLRSSLFGDSERLADLLSNVAALLPLLQLMLWSSS